jgi:methylated-DNA-protein-cysteine methyltransferase-like protein
MQTANQSQLPSFYQQVYEVVRLIPKGRVMSYGGVARQCGRPGQARAVGYALHMLPAGLDVPWWRVINVYGRISIPSPEAAQRQREKLEAEGVEVDDNLRTDMRTYDAEIIVYARLRKRKGEVKRQT